MSGDILQKNAAALKRASEFMQKAGEAQRAQDRATIDAELAGTTPRNAKSTIEDTGKYASSGGGGGGASFIDGSYGKIEVTIYGSNGAPEEVKLYDPALVLKYVETFSWNPDGTLNTLVVKDGTGVTLRTFTYSWNVDGSFQSVTLS